MLYTNFQQDSNVTFVFIEENVIFTEKYENLAFHVARFFRKKR